MVVDDDVAALDVGGQGGHGALRAAGHDEEFTYLALGVEAAGGEDLVAAVL